MDKLLPADHRSWNRRRTHRLDHPEDIQALKAISRCLTLRLKQGSDRDPFRGRNERQNKNVKNKKYNTILLTLFSIVILTLISAKYASANTTITPLPYSLATTTGWKQQETAYGNAMLAIIGGNSLYNIDEEVGAPLTLTIWLQNRGNMWNYDNAPGACLVADLKYYDGTEHHIATSTRDCISNQGNNVFEHTFTWATTTLTDIGVEYIFHIYYTNSGNADINSYAQMAMISYNGSNPTATAIKEITGGAPLDDNAYIYLYHPTSTEVLGDFSNWGTKSYYGTDLTDYPYSKICINYGTSTETYSNCGWVGPTTNTAGYENTFALLKTHVLENGTYWANSYYYGYDGENYFLLASSSNITFTINAPQEPGSLYNEYINQLTGIGNETITTSTSPCPNTGFFSSSTISALGCELQYAMRSTINWLLIPPTSTFAFIGNEYDIIKNNFPFVLVFGIGEKVQDYIASSSYSAANIQIQLPYTPRFASTTITIFSTSSLGNSFGQTAYNAYANFVLTALGTVMIIALISMI